LDPDRIVVDRGRWQLFNTALPVIIAVLLGLAFQAWRRRQVTRNT